MEIGMGEVMFELKLVDEGSEIRSHRITRI
jgi:hypothetical protein